MALALSSSRSRFQDRNEVGIWRQRTSPRQSVEISQLSGRVSGLSGRIALVTPATVRTRSSRRSALSDTKSLAALQQLVLPDEVLRHRWERIVLEGRA
jgi:hypothetical protein